MAERAAAQAIDAPRAGSAAGAAPARVALSAGIPAPGAARALMATCANETDGDPAPQAGVPDLTVTRVATPICTLDAGTAMPGEAFWDGDGADGPRRNVGSRAKGWVAVVVLVVMLAVAGGAIWLTTGFRDPHQTPPVAARSTSAATAPTTTSTQPASPSTSLTPATPTPSAAPARSTPASSAPAPQEAGADGASSPSTTQPAKKTTPQAPARQAPPRPTTPPPAPAGPAGTGRATATASASGPRAVHLGFDYAVPNGVTCTGS